MVNLSYIRRFGRCKDQENRLDHKLVHSIVLDDQFLASFYGVAFYIDSLGYQDDDSTFGRYRGNVNLGVENYSHSHKFSTSSRTKPGPLKINPL